MYILSHRGKVNEITFYTNNLNFRVLLEMRDELTVTHSQVSRCCGLKITSEGYVVTLAKNNHHVLVLNTLYVH